MADRVATAHFFNISWLVCVDPGAITAPYEVPHSNRWTPYRVVRPAIIQREGV